MNCRQCGNKCRVKFEKMYCSRACAGYKPREVKHRAFFKVEDKKVVYVDAGVEPFDMPAHYVIEDATPEKLAKKHAEKLRTHNTRNALKREFQELRGDK